MLSARNIQKRRIHFDDFRLISEEEFASENRRTQIRAGDVLLTIVGAIGRTAVVPDGLELFTLQRSVAVLRTQEAAPRLLSFFLESPALQRFFEENAKGTAQKGIYLKALSEAPCPLPPLPEQMRIADKLDALLARVEAGRERLERVPGLLKRFRQSVLSAAVSGELTREWRGGGDADWMEKPLNQVAFSKLGKMLDQNKNIGTLRPYLRNVNVRWFSFQLDDVYSLRVEDAERLALSVRAGDVLICEGGEPGRCAVWDGEEGVYVYQKALHRVRVGDELNPHWLTFCLKVSADSEALEDHFTGTTIKHLTGAALARFPVPLPPLSEQLEIVSRVEALFAIADRIEARYQSALTTFNRLTPALLAKAFRGELVPQHPNDEPASVLLERIRATRAASGEKLKRGRQAGKGTAKGVNSSDGAEPKRRGRSPKVQAGGDMSAASAITQASSYEDAVRKLEAQKLQRAQGTRQISLFGAED